MILKLLIIICCILQSIAVEKNFNLTVGNASVSSRIVGGRDANSNEAPFKCSLQIRRVHQCGCTIISTKWILVAAHCVRFEMKDYEILVGTNKLDSGGTRYRAHLFFPHESFEGKPRLINDIGLIRIEGVFEFNELVKPVEYLSDFLGSYQAVQLSGWGRTSKDGTLPNNLRVLDLETINNEDCENAISLEVHESHLCAIPKYGGGACKGDSGGPLIFRGVLVGISIWSVQCGRGFPDVFTRISHVHDWIERVRCRVETEELE